MPAKKRGHAAGPARPSTGSPRGKRRAADGEASSRAAPSTSRPAAQPCLRCRAEPRSRPWYYTKKGQQDEPLDNKCLNCYSAYLTGWQQKGSWEEVCELCHETEEVDLAFTVSVLISRGEKEPTWVQEHIDKTSVFELVVSQALRGLNHNQFRSLYGGFNPEDLGYRALELKGIDDKAYRGVLMVDPESPGIKYTLNRRVVLSRREPRLGPESHIHPAQGAEVFGRMEDDETEKKTHTIYTKFRTCTLTHEQIMKAVAEKDGSSDARSSGAGAGPAALCRTKSPRLSLPLMCNPPHVAPHGEADSEPEEAEAAEGRGDGRELSDGVSKFLAMAATPGMPSSGARDATSQAGSLRSGVWRGDGHRRAPSPAETPKKPESPQERGSFV